MLTAYSAVTIANIPADAKIVFAYANPPYAQLTEVRELCPKARIVPIATHPEYMGEMYDFENGALTPEDAGATIRQALNRGIHHPICYFSLANHTMIVGSLTKAHVNRMQVRLCVAHYTSSPQLPVWADGVQWCDRVGPDSLNEYELRDDFFNYGTVTQPTVRAQF